MTEKKVMLWGGPKHLETVTIHEGDALVVADYRGDKMGEYRKARVRHEDLTEIWDWRVDVAAT